MQTKYIKTAIRFGNRICREAIRHNGKTNWIACASESGLKVSKSYYQALKGDWYSGTSGIAFFLAHLYEYSNETLHKTIAIEAIHHALDRMEDIEYGKLGFHSGITGIAFSAINVGEKLHQIELVNKGLSLLEGLNQLPLKEYTLDIIDGCAGAIPVLLKVIKKYPSSDLNELLQKMGNYLLQKSQQEKIGCSWNTMEHGTKGNLTGYAHGASGIAIALLELWKYTNNNQFLDAANNGFIYEESLFVKNQKNWPDLRTTPNESSDINDETVCSCAWCHGAPGIGLARLRAYELTQNPTFMTYAQNAIDTTYNQLELAKLGNYSLCHGVFGNAELLVYAYEVTGEKKYLTKARKAGDSLIKNYEETARAIPNGTQTDYFSPDMMLGLAGIGYYYLRINDPAKFNSVLLINPN